MTTLRHQIWSLKITHKFGLLFFLNRRNRTVQRQNCQVSRTNTPRVPALPHNLVGGWLSNKDKTKPLAAQEKMSRYLRSQAPLTRSRRISGAVEALNTVNSPMNCASSLDHPLQQTPQDVLFYRLRAARDEFALSCGGLWAMRLLEWTLLLVLLVRPCQEGTPCWCRLGNNLQSSAIHLRLCDVQIPQHHVR